MCVRICCVCVCVCVCVSVCVFVFVCVCLYDCMCVFKFLFQTAIFLAKLINIIMTIESHKVYTKSDEITQTETKTNKLIN